LLAGLGGLKMTTATGLAHLPDTSEERAAPTAEVAALRRGRGGTSLGRAVHAVLQSIDLATLADLDELARGHSAAEGIAERSVEVAMLVRSVCNSPSVRRAVASGSYWREVPIGVALNNTILEGYVDLVFAGAHGIEVVDYKTDSVSSAQMAERMNQYSLQGDAYRLALESATGSEVEQVTFVFAALGEEAIVPADPELRQRLIGLSG
jgi:ATP-dependent helicase/nuclease subunit A